MPAAEHLVSGALVRVVQEYDKATRDEARAKGRALPPVYRLATVVGFGRGPKKYNPWAGEWWSQSTGSTSQ